MSIPGSMNQIQSQHVRRELAELRSRIERLEASDSQGDPSLADAIAQFMAITHDVLGESSFAAETDPETGDSYFAAQVKCSGSDQEADAACDQWHRRIAGELPQWIGRFVLDVRFA